MRTSCQISIAVIACTAMLVSAFSVQDVPGGNLVNLHRILQETEKDVETRDRAMMSVMLCQIVVRSTCHRHDQDSSHIQQNGNQIGALCSSAIQMCDPILRGRRNGGPITVNPDAPPGFFASRGRRSSPTSEESEENGHQTNDQNNKFPNLYVRGFLGTRG